MINFTYNWEILGFLLKYINKFDFEKIDIYCFDTRFNYLELCGF